MATITEKQFAAPTAIGTSAATLFTADGSAITVVLSIVIVNTSSTAIKDVRVALGTMATDKALVYDYPMLPNETLIIKGPIVMATSEIFTHQAGATGCTITVSGYEAS